MLSFDVRHVKIGDTSEIAKFLTFFQGYSLWFFFNEKVDRLVGRRSFVRDKPSSREVV